MSSLALLILSCTLDLVKKKKKKKVRLVVNYNLMYFRFRLVL